MKTRKRKREGKRVCLLKKLPVYYMLELDCVLLLVSLFRFDSIQYINQSINHVYLSTQTQYNKINSKKQNCVNWTIRLNSTYNCPER